MEPSELKIDVAGVAREAIAERAPEEDLDEAILRSCKKLYGEAGMIAFQAVQSAATALAQREDGDREKALRHIADGKASVNVVARMRITQRGSTKSLDDLSPEMRAEVEKALASGKSGKIIISQAVNRKAASGSLAGSSRQMTHCAKCGYEFPSGLPSCPQCGTEKKHPFWSRLFGR
jgi:HPt (histidine-containing phosphotransfer) domain-containing protein